MAQNKTLSIGIFYKFVSIFLVLSFVLFNCSINQLSTAYAEPPLEGLSHSHGIEANPRLVLDSLGLPEGLGTLYEKFEGSKVKDLDRLIIYLQNAHTNLDSENHIKKLIEYFQNEFNVSLVMLEGGEGRLDSLFFKSFPDQEIKEKILSEYLKNGEISGGEMASILTERFSNDYYGIETQELYEENRSAFLKAVEKTQLVAKKIEVLEQYLHEQSEKLFRGHLKFFWQQFQEFRNQRSDFLSYVKELSGLLNDETLLKNAYPEMEKMLFLDRNEKQVSSGEIDGIVHQMVKAFEIKVLPKLDSALQVEMGTLIHEYRMGQKDAAEIVARIQDMAALHHIDAKIPAALEPLIRHAQTIESIRGTKIFEELQSLEVRLKQQLPETSDEKQLLDDLFLLETFKDFSRLELVHDDWNQLQGRKPSQMFHAEVFDEHARRVLSELDRLFEDHYAFYELAGKRDAALLQNALRLMDQQEKRVGIVVTGGFHSEGITEKMRDLDLPFLLIAPKINRIGDKEIYLNAMRGDVSYMKYFNGSLWDALAKDYTSKLAAALESSELTPSLKKWRDRIIQNAIAEGKVTEAGSYTKYVDALVQALRKEYERSSPFESVSFKAEELREQIDQELNSLFDSYIEKLGSLVSAKMKVLNDGLTDLWTSGDISMESVGRVLHQMNSVKTGNIAAAIALIREGPAESLDVLTKFDPSVQNQIAERMMDEILSILDGMNLNDAINQLRALNAVSVGEKVAQAHARLQQMDPVLRNLLLNRLIERGQSLSRPEMRNMERSEASLPVPRTNRQVQEAYDSFQGGRIGQIGGYRYELSILTTEDNIARRGGPRSSVATWWMNAVRLQFEEAKRRNPGLDPARFRILEVGAGDGLLARKLAEAGYDVTGADFDRAFVDAASKNNPYPDRLRFIQADATNLEGYVFEKTEFAGVPDESFDLIISNEWLGNVPIFESQALQKAERDGRANVHPVFYEFIRKMKPGAAYMLHDFNEDNSGTTVQDDVGYINYSVADRMRALIAAGFTNIEEHHVATSLPPSHGVPFSHGLIARKPFAHQGAVNAGRPEMRSSLAEEVPGFIELVNQLEVLLREQRDESVGDIANELLVPLEYELSLLADDPDLTLEEAGIANITVLRQLDRVRLDLASVPGIDEVLLERISEHMGALWDLVPRDWYNDDGDLISIRDEMGDYEPFWPVKSKQGDELILNIEDFVSDNELDEVIDSTMTKVRERLWRQEEVASVRLSLKTEVAKKHIVVGDIHGNLEGLLQDLLEAGLIDTSGNWSGKNQILVQMGDVIDRGHYGLETMRYLDRLQEQARKSGGDVIRLIGNHELLVLQNNLKYALQYLSMDEIEAVKNKIVTDIQNGKLFAAYETGDVLLVHGGVTKQMAAGRSAAQMAEYLNGQLYRGLFGEWSPVENALWNRYGRNVSGDGLAFDQIVAHTPEGIEGAQIRMLAPADGAAAVINVDIGHADVFGRNRGFVEMEGDQVRAVSLVSRERQRVKPKGASRGPRSEMVVVPAPDLKLFGGSERLALAAEFLKDVFQDASKILAIGPNEIVAGTFSFELNSEGNISLFQFYPSDVNGAEGAYVNIGTLMDRGMSEQLTRILDFGKELALQNKKLQRSPVAIAHAYGVHMDELLKKVAASRAPPRLPKGLTQRLSLRERMNYESRMQKIEDSAKSAIKQLALMKPEQKLALVVQMVLDLKRAPTQEELLLFEGSSIGIQKISEFPDIGTELLEKNHIPDHYAGFIELPSDILGRLKKARIKIPGTSEWGVAFINDPGRYGPERLNGNEMNYFREVGSYVYRKGERKAALHESVHHRAGGKTGLPFVERFHPDDMSVLEELQAYFAMNLRQNGTVDTSFATKSIELAIGYVELNPRVKVPEAMAAVAAVRKLSEVLPGRDVYHIIGRAHSLQELIDLGKLDAEQLRSEFRRGFSPAEVEHARINGFNAQQTIVVNYSEEVRNGAHLRQDADTQQANQAYSDEFIARAVYVLMRTGGRPELRLIEQWMNVELQEDPALHTAIRRALGSFFGVVSESDMRNRLSRLESSPAGRYELRTPQVWLETLSNQINADNILQEHPKIKARLLELLSGLAGVIPIQDLFSAAYPNYTYEAVIRDHNKTPALELAMTAVKDAHGNDVEWTESNVLNLASEKIHVEIQEGRQLIQSQIQRRLEDQNFRQLLGRLLSGAAFNAVSDHEKMKLIWRMLVRLDAADFRDLTEQFARQTDLNSRTVKQILKGFINEGSRFEIISHSKKLVMAQPTRAKQQVPADQDLSSEQVDVLATNKPLQKAAAISANFEGQKIVSQNEVNDFVPREISSLFEIAAELNLQIVLTGGTARDFAGAVTAKRKGRFPKTTDFDILIVFPQDALPEDGHHFEAGYAAFEQKLQEKLLEYGYPKEIIQKLRLDFIPGVFIDGHYVGEHMMSVQAGNALSISRLGVEKVGDEFVIFGQKDAITDLESRTLNIWIDDEFDVGDIMAAKMLGKAGIYFELGGFRFNEQSLVKIDSELSRVRAMNRTKEFMNDLFRHVQLSSDTTEQSMDRLRLLLETYHLDEPMRLGLPLDDLLDLIGSNEMARAEMRGNVELNMQEWETSDLLAEIFKQVESGNHVILLGDELRYEIVNPMGRYTEGDWAVFEVNSHDEEGDWESSMLKIYPQEYIGEGEGLVSFQDIEKLVRILEVDQQVQAIFPAIIHVDTSLGLVETETIEGTRFDRLPQNQKLEVFLRLLKAFAYLHRTHKVFHRDIDPINILVTADGMPKVIDLDLLAVRNEETRPIANFPFSAKFGDMNDLGKLLFTEVYGGRIVEDHDKPIEFFVLQDLDVAKIMNMTSLERTEQTPRLVLDVIKKAVFADPNLSYDSLDTFYDDLIAALDEEGLLPESFQLERAEHRQEMSIKEQIDDLQKDFHQQLEQLKMDFQSLQNAFMPAYADLFDGAIRNVLKVHQLEDRLTVFALGSLGRRAPPYGTDIDLLLMRDVERPPSQRQIEDFIDNLERVLDNKVDFPARLNAMLRPAYAPDRNEFAADLNHFDGIGLRSLLDLRFVAGSPANKTFIEQLFEKQLASMLSEWLIPSDEMKALIHHERTSEEWYDGRSNVKELADEDKLQFSDSLLAHLQRVDEKIFFHPNRFAPKNGPSGTRTIDLIGYLGRIVKGLAVWDWQKTNLIDLFQELERRKFLSWDEQDAQALADARDFMLRLRTAITISGETHQIPMLMRGYLVPQVKQDVAHLMNMSLQDLDQALRRHHDSVASILGYVLSEYEKSSRRSEERSEESIRANIDRIEAQIQGLLSERDRNWERSGLEAAGETPPLFQEYTDQIRELLAQKELLSKALEEIQQQRSEMRSDKISQLRLQNFNFRFMNYGRGVNDEALRNLRKRGLVVRGVDQSNFREDYYFKFDGSETKGRVDYEYGLLQEALNRDPSLASIIPAFNRFIISAEDGAHIREQVLPQDSSYRVFDRGIIDFKQGSPFLVFRAAHGTALHNLLNNEMSLTAAQVLDVLTALAEAVSRLQAAGVFNRDLNPIDIFVSFDETGVPHIQIIDFELAVIPDREDFSMDRLQEIQPDWFNAGNVFSGYHDAHIEARDVLAVLRIAEKWASEYPALNEFAATIRGIRNEPWWNDEQYTPDLIKRLPGTEANASPATNVLQFFQYAKTTFATTAQGQDGLARAEMRTPAKRVLGEISAFVQAEGIDPVLAVQQAFESHQVVAVGEHHAHKEAGVFVLTLPEKLKEAGVTHIVFEFMSRQFNGILSRGYQIYQESGLDAAREYLTEAADRFSEFASHWSNAFTRELVFGAYQNGILPVGWEATADEFERYAVKVRKSADAAFYDPFRNEVGFKVVDQLLKANPTAKVFLYGGQYHTQLQPNSISGLLKDAGYAVYTFWQISPSVNGDKRFFDTLSKVIHQPMSMPIAGAPFSNEGIKGYRAIPAGKLNERTDAVIFHPTGAGEIPGRAEMRLPVDDVLVQFVISKIEKGEVQSTIGGISEFLTGIIQSPEEIEFLAQIIWNRRLQTAVGDNFNRVSDLIDAGVPILRLGGTAEDLFRQIVRMNQLQPEGPLMLQWNWDSLSDDDAFEFLTQVREDFSRPDLFFGMNILLDDLEAGLTPERGATFVMVSTPDGAETAAEAGFYVLMKAGIKDPLDPKWFQSADAVVVSQRVWRQNQREIAQIREALPELKILLHVYGLTEFQKARSMKGYDGIFVDLLKGEVDLTDQVLEAVNHRSRSELRALEIALLLISGLSAGYGTYLYLQLEKIRSFQKRFYQRVVAFGLIGLAFMGGIYLLTSHAKFPSPNLMRSNQTVSRPAEPLLPPLRLAPFPSSTRVQQPSVRPAETTVPVQRRPETTVPSVQQPSVQPTATQAVPVEVRLLSYSFSILNRYFGQNRAEPFPELPSVPLSVALVPEEQRQELVELYSWMLGRSSKVLGQLTAFRSLMRLNVDTQKFMLPLDPQKNPPNAYIERFGAGLIVQLMNHHHVLTQQTQPLMLMYEPEVKKKRSAAVKEAIEKLMGSSETRQKQYLFAEYHLDSGKDSSVIFIDRDGKYKWAKWKDGKMSIQPYSRDISVPKYGVVIELAGGLDALTFTSDQLKEKYDQELLPLLLAFLQYANESKIQLTKDAQLPVLGFIGRGPHGALKGTETFPGNTGVARPFEEYDDFYKNGKWPEKTRPELRRELEEELSEIEARIISDLQTGLIFPETSGSKQRLNQFEAFLKQRTGKAALITGPESLLEFNKTVLRSVEHSSQGLWKSIREFQLKDALKSGVYLVTALSQLVLQFTAPFNGRNYASEDHVRSTAAGEVRFRAGDITEFAYSGRGKIYWTALLPFLLWNLFPFSLTFGSLLTLGLVIGNTLFIYGFIWSLLRFGMNFSGHEMTHAYQGIIVDTIRRELGFENEITGRDFDRFFPPEAREPAVLGVARRVPSKSKLEQVARDVFQNVRERALPELVRLRQAGMLDGRAEMRSQQETPAFLRLHEEMYELRNRMATYHMNARSKMSAFKDEQLKGAGDVGVRTYLRDLIVDFEDYIYISDTVQREAAIAYENAVRMFANDQTLPFEQKEMLLDQMTRMDSVIEYEWQNLHRMYDEVLDDFYDWVARKLPEKQRWARNLMILLNHILNAEAPSSVQSVQQLSSYREQIRDIVQLLEENLNFLDSGEQQQAKELIERSIKVAPQKMSLNDLLEFYLKGGIFQTLKDYGLVNIVFLNEAMFNSQDAMSYEAFIQSLSIFRKQIRERFGIEFKRRGEMDFDIDDSLATAHPDQYEWLSMEDREELYETFLFLNSFTQIAANMKRREEFQGRAQRLLRILRMQEDVSFKYFGDRFEAETDAGPNIMIIDRLGALEEQRPLIDIVNDYNEALLELQKYDLEAQMWYFSGEDLEWDEEAESQREELARQIKNVEFQLEQYRAGRERSEVRTSVYRNGIRLSAYLLGLGLAKDQAALLISQYRNRYTENPAAVSGNPQYLVQRYGVPQEIAGFFAAKNFDFSDKNAQSRVLYAAEMALQRSEMRADWDDAHMEELDRAWDKIETDMMLGDDHFFRPADDTDLANQATWATFYYLEAIRTLEEHPLRNDVISLAERDRPYLARQELARLYLYAVLAISTFYRLRWGHITSRTTVFKNVQDEESHRLVLGFMQRVPEFLNQASQHLTQLQDNLATIPATDDLLISERDEVSSNLEQMHEEFKSALQERLRLLENRNISISSDVPLTLNELKNNQQLLHLLRGRRLPTTSDLVRRQWVKTFSNAVQHLLDGNFQAAGNEFASVYRMVGMYWNVDDREWFEETSEVASLGALLSFELWYQEWQGKTKLGERSEMRSRELEPFINSLKQAIQWKEPPFRSIRRLFSATVEQVPVPLIDEREARIAGAGEFIIPLPADFNQVLEYIEANNNKPREQLKDLSAAIPVLINQLQERIRRFVSTIVLIEDEGERKAIFQDGLFVDHIENRYFIRRLLSVLVSYETPSILPHLERILRPYTYSYFESELANFLSLGHIKEMGRASVGAMLLWAGLVQEWQNDRFRLPLNPSNPSSIRAAEYLRMLDLAEGGFVLTEAGLTESIELKDSERLVLFLIAEGAMEIRDRFTGKPSLVISQRNGAYYLSPPMTNTSSIFYDSKLGFSEAVASYAVPNFRINGARSLPGESLLLSPGVAWTIGRGVQANIQLINVSTLINPVHGQIRVSEDGKTLEIKNLSPNGLVGFFDVVPARSEMRSFAALDRLFHGETARGEIPGLPPIQDLRSVLGREHAQLFWDVKPGDPAFLLLISNRAEQKNYYKRLREGNPLSKAEMKLWREKAMTAAVMNSRSHLKALADRIDISMYVLELFLHLDSEVETVVSIRSMKPYMMHHALMEETFHVLEGMMREPFMKPGSFTRDSNDPNFFFQVVMENVNDFLQLMFIPASSFKTAQSHYVQWDQESSRHIQQQFIVESGLNPNTNLYQIIHLLRDFASQTQVQPNDFITSLERIHPDLRPKKWDEFVPPYVLQQYLDLLIKNERFSKYPQLFPHWNVPAEWGLDEFPAISAALPVSDPFAQLLEPAGPSLRRNPRLGTGKPQARQEMRRTAMQADLVKEGLKSFDLTQIVAGTVEASPELVSILDRLRGQDLDEISSEWSKKLIDELRQWREGFPVRLIANQLIKLPEITSETVRNEIFQFLNVSDTDPVAGVVFSSERLEFLIDLLHKAQASGQISANLETELSQIMLQAAQDLVSQLEGISTKVRVRFYVTPEMVSADGQIRRDLLEQEFTGLMETIRNLLIVNPNFQFELVTPDIDQRLAFNRGLRTIYDRMRVRTDGVASSGLLVDPRIMNEADVTIASASQVVSKGIVLDAVVFSDGSNVSYYGSEKVLLEGELLGAVSLLTRNVAEGLVEVDKNLFRAQGPHVFNQFFAYAVRLVLQQRAETLMARSA